MRTKYFDQVQVFGLIGLGVVFWGLGVATIRYGGHIMYANNRRRIASYIAGIPLGYIMIRTSELLLSITPKQRVTTTAIVACAAIMLDGIALMWFPTLYENPPLRQRNTFSSISFSRMGAAWLLWGVGTALLVAIITQP